MNSISKNRKIEFQLNTKQFVTIIVPAYNEEDVLELFYIETCKVIDQEKLSMFNFEFFYK